MITYKQHGAIAAFVADFDNESIQVRGKVRPAGTRELRTRKNDHLAVIWDELGNTFVLGADCIRRQLIGSEYKGG